MAHHVHRVVDKNPPPSGEWEFERSAEGQLRALIDNLIDPSGERIITVLPHYSGFLVITGD